MKKYFNKGLIYQWFNSAKMMILLGIVAWGFWSNMMVEDQINITSHFISENFDNGYSTYSIFNYVILGIIFVMIHFMSQGINKRNNNMFLTSAPYTKKQIKYNEFICLMINLFIFIAVFAYINIMAYIRHNELMTIIDGYFKVFGIEVLKMILFGTTGILVLLIVDSMFSNAIIGIICMISILPGALFFIVCRLFTVLDYISWGNDDSLLSKIGDFVGVNLFGGENIYLFDYVDSKIIKNSKLFSESAVVIVIIVALLAIYCTMQKKYKVESNTKMFTSRLNEKIVVIFSSIGAGAALSTLFLDPYIYKLKGMSYGLLTGINLVKALGIEFGIITLASFIAYKIVNKFLKNIQ